MTKGSWKIEYTAVIFVVLTALAVFFKVMNADVDYCRRIFKGLSQGSVSVENLIDWENLKALDQDIGADYRALRNEAERIAYRRAFIRSFSLGFTQAEPRSGNFVNWRLDSKNTQSVTVAADQLDKNRKRIKTILLTVSLYPRKKLISLRAYTGARPTDK